MGKITREKLTSMFDHTLLKADATKKDFVQLCKEAKELKVAMVAINSAPVSWCKELLKDTKIHVGAAISFPLGQTPLEIKLAEVNQAIMDGADEIDYVVNIGKVKMKDWDYIEEEMKQITDICRKYNTLCKVIFENCYLEKEEIIKLASIARKIKPDYIKTSTGFGTGGALIEDVKLMKKYAGETVKVKAAGGIRDWSTCKQMIEAGAQRIGTSSAYAILDGYDKENIE